MIVEAPTKDNTTGVTEKNILVLKKVGSAPATIANVVNPNEKPGLPGNTFEMATRVTGMERLNRNKPIIPATAN